MRRGVRLTDQGRRLYGYARQILDLVDEATGQVAQARQHVSGELRIAMEANSNDAIRAAVERGVGVALLSQRALRNQTGLSPVKVRGFRPRRQLYVISDPCRIPSAPARQFLAFLDAWNGG